MTDDTQTTFGKQDVEEGIAGEWELVRSWQSSLDFFEDAVHIDCTHLDQLTDARFNPAGEKPPKVSAEGFGELPLRWCLTCTHQGPTSEQIKEQYGHYDGT